MVMDNPNETVQVSASLPRWMAEAVADALQLLTDHAQRPRPADTPLHLCLSVSVAAVGPINPHTGQCDISQRAVAAVLTADNVTDEMSLLDRSRAVNGMLVAAGQCVAACQRHALLKTQKFADAFRDATGEPETDELVLEVCRQTFLDACTTSAPPWTVARDYDDAQAQRSKSPAGS